MNRYETTITITVTANAATEEAARRKFEKIEDTIAKRPWARYVEASDEIDCMEVATQRER